MTMRDDLSPSRELQLAEVPFEGFGTRHQIRQMAEVRGLSREEMDERKIIHPAMQNRDVLNVFRDLRTLLLQRAGKQNFSVAVTSLSHGGGASYVALNLAAAFALDHAKTSLLVDCNLYAPSVDKLLYVEPEYGLTEYLENPSLGVDDIIYSSGVPRMRIIPVGHSHLAGAEYYASSRMERFLGDVRDRYPDRYVVLDTPPVGLSAEARILIELCDFVLLVVPYGKVTQEQVLSGVESLPADKFAGVVFNNG